MQKTLAAICFTLCTLSTIPGAFAQDWDIFQPSDKHTYEFPVNIPVMVGSAARPADEIGKEWGARIVHPNGKVTRFTIDKAGNFGFFYIRPPEGAADLLEGNYTVQVVKIADMRWTEQKKITFKIKYKAADDDLPLPDEDPVNEDPGYDDPYDDPDYGDGAGGTTLDDVIIYPSVAPFGMPTESEGDW